LLIPLLSFQITINDLPVGRSVDEALRLVDAFKFTEEFGDVCPANWVKGADTIKADPVGAKKYFEKTHAGENGEDKVMSNGH
jgi:peroxiredoxin 2/4